MAPFNPPQNPVNPKDYTNDFRPTSGGVVDQSSGLALKAFGEGIGDLATIADKFVKTKAENETREGFESLRDMHIQNLQAITQGTQVIPQPAATPDGKVADKPSLMDANASMDVPPNLQQGMARIATLSTAAEGKANDTPYTAQQNALLKYYRSQYPGYRAYIDATASSVTGKDPANAYAENLMQDLNQQRAGAKSEIDKTLTKIRDYAGYKTVDGTTMSQMFDYVRTNGIGALSNANRWIDEVARTEVDYKLKTARVTSHDQDIKSQKENAEQALSSAGNGIVNNEFYSNAARGDLMSSSKIAERITEEGLYPGTYSAKDMLEAGTVLNTRRSVMEAKLLSEADRPLIDPATNKPAVDPYGNTLTLRTVLGSKTNEIIQQALKPYDISVKAALDEKTGTATFAASHAQRYKDDVANGFLTDPTNIAMVKLGIVNREAGPQVANETYKEWLTVDGDKKTLNWLSDKRTNMLIGPNTEAGITKQPTFKNDIEEAKNGTTTGKPLAPETKIYDNLAEGINKMADPSTPDKLKLRIANYYFDPANSGVLSNFQQGYRDQKGNWVPGREAVWDTLTHKTVTDEIARLSKLPGGNLIAKNYKNWMEQEFAQYMFQPNVQDLNKPETYTTPTLDRTGRVVDVADKVHIGYVSNDKEQKFIMLDKNNQPLDIDYTGGATKVPRQPGEAGALRRYSESIGKLNEGIKNLTQMEKSLGGDVNAYLWDTLVNKLRVFQPDANMTGLPGKLAEAIRHANKPARKIEDSLKLGDTAAQGLE